MKTCIWTIKLYSDDEKTKLLFEKDYKNVNEIVKDFKLSKNFLYNSCRKDKYRNDSVRKNYVNKKYNRMSIIKQSFTKNGTKINSFVR